MNIETLEAYWGIASEIKAIEKEINTLYGDHSSQSKESQTGRDVVKERLTSKQRQWSEVKLAIEEWLDTVGDAEIRAIVRWHYILGYNWKMTSLKVYGRGDYYIARKRIYRYFGKQ